MEGQLGKFRDRFSEVFRKEGDSGDEDAPTCTIQSLGLVIKGNAYLQQETHNKTKEVLFHFGLLGKLPGWADETDDSRNCSR
jgi:hypothetical protein